jgi:dihydroxy-acid dehydratase
MEDLYYAGGLPAVIKAMLPLLNKDVITVNGKTVQENYADSDCYDAEVISSFRRSIQ